MLGQSPAGKWETEVFLLRAENRGELLEVIRALADYLKRTPSVELMDLAFTLNTRIMARGREAVRERYSWEAIEGQLIAFYARLCEGL